jgi:hypothetical protein
MQRIYDAPGNLHEFALNKSIQLRVMMTNFYHTGYFLFVVLILTGFLIYYVLQYLIGIRLGMQLYSS